MARHGLLIAIAVVVLIAGALQLTRPGYSVDEEFTVFAVRGIEAHGLPILPSNLLYDRGVAYSYAAWLAKQVTGAELPAFRALSLVSAAAAAWLVGVFVRNRRDAVAAVMSSAVVATSIPFWATATSGRFYAPFLALYVATLIVADASLALTGAMAFLCRLTHELAFTLVVIPAACWIVDRQRRSWWFRVGAAMGAGLVFGQLLLLALHWLAPSDGSTMVKRFFLWQVVNLFERPAAGQFSIPLVLMVIGCLLAPRRTWLISVAALSLSAMILAFLLAQASNVTPLSLAVVRDVLVSGSRYPLDMFWRIAETTPLTLVTALLFLCLRLGGAGGAWPPIDRAMHGLWIGWVSWFGVIESGITTNYLLMPITFMLMAIAVDVHAVLIKEGVPARRLFSAASRPAYAAAIVLLLLVARDQWRLHSLADARPTISADGVDAIRQTLQPTDRIVCTDELGCLMTIGRIDRWLALDRYVRERFLVTRADGTETGVYTGVPAAFRPSDVLEPNADGSVPPRILIVDIFKDYPIGNSRTWLPRAADLDGIPVIPLLETPQLRIVQLSQPERHARR